MGVPDRPRKDGLLLPVAHYKNFPSGDLCAPIFGPEVGADFGHCTYILTEL